MGRRTERRYSQNLYPWVGDPQMGRKLQLQRFSPRSEGSKPHIGLLSLGVLHQEDESSERLCLKGSRTYFQES